jgi:Cysteine-rich CPCC
VGLERRGTTVVWCDVYVRVPGLDPDGSDRLVAAMHAADRRLGVIVRGSEFFYLLTREADGPAAREYAKRILVDAGRRAGIEHGLIDGAVIEQVALRQRDLTGMARRIEAPPGRYRAVDVGEFGSLHALHGGELGEWVVYRDDDPKTAVAGRDLLEVIDELFELPHGRKAPWVYDAIERLAGHRTPLGVRYACPCCEFLTLTEPPSGTYAICPVCWWEDDSVQFRDPDYTGGANRPSLREARATYRRIGVSESRLLEYARPPAAEERPS